MLNNVSKCCNEFIVKPQYKMLIAYFPFSIQKINSKTNGFIYTRKPHFIKISKPCKILYWNKLSWNHPFNMINVYVLDDTWIFCKFSLIYLMKRKAKRRVWLMFRISKDKIQNYYFLRLLSHTSLSPLPQKHNLCLPSD